ncbi:MAG: hypothetical protein AAFV85_27955 [Cyanobacteria bacterium J06634_6]
MKIVKTVMPTERRYALYVDSALGEKVKKFHEDNNQDKQLWFSAEAVVKAGLEALGVSIDESETQVAA